MSPIAKLSTGAALLAIAALFGGVMYATGGSAPLDSGAFSKGLAVRVELSRDEEIRNVELYPDMITAKHSVADHRDGSITNYWYRVDGTLEKAITEGKADAEGHRPKLRHAEVAPDGKTYLYDVEYFPSGGKSKETRLDGDKLVRSYFHNNGVERRAQIILRDKKGWKLFQEDLFREDKSLAESLRNADNNAWERKFFSEEGVLVGSKAMGPYGSRYTEIAYQKDGVTKARQMEQNSSGTVLTTYRPNGSRDQERTYTGPVKGASMRVVAFDEKDHQIYQQWWTYADNKTYLWLVKVFRTEDQSLWRTIYTEKESSEATEIVYKGDGEYGSTFVRRKFGKDGNLSLEEDVVDHKTVATREFTPAQKIRLTLPAEYTTLREIKPLPPQVVEYAPPPMGGP